MQKVDTPFLYVALALLFFGLLVFTSAAFGYFARNPEGFRLVMWKQIATALIGGGVALYIGMRMPYRLWKRFALPIFVLALFFMILVLIPGIGAELGGARRWIEVGPITFQPGDYLKIAFVLYFAALLSTAKEKVKTFSAGTAPMLVFFAIIAILFLLQPHTGLFIVTTFTGLVMFFVAGGRLSHIALIILIAVCGVFVLATTRPYVKERLTTFISPEAADPLKEGFQTRQALIAIGSGGFSGRGFGKSLSRFENLPEPIGDSIFAVLGEEFGFLGSSVIVILFFLFALFGFRIAARAPDDFSRLVTVGIVILIVSQSLWNIGAMLSVLPLSGIPLLFISQGGTAILSALFGVGIVLNISKYRS